MRRVGGTIPPAAGWFKVTVSHGAKYEKMDLLKTMLDNCTQKFAPIAYNKLGPHIQFYVQSRQMSEAISAMSQNVVLSDGFKLTVRSESSPPPPTLLDDAAKERMKLVMSSRYKLQ